MTVHLISVGLSVLRSLEEPRKPLESDSGLLDAVLDASPRPDKLLTPSGTRETDTDRERASEWMAGTFGIASPPGPLRELAGRIRPWKWPRKMSAELDTFARASGGGKFVLGRTDIAVLICSDTLKGLLAGAWNAVAIAGGDFGRIRYVADPADPSAFDGDARGHVVLVRVTGMDAGHKGFRDAMRGLGFLARHLFESGTVSSGEEFRFYLSGGFKAAFPYLIGLAEAVRSVDDECLPEGLTVPEPCWPVTAYVQHETAPLDANPIRVPLRRLIAASVREELSGYDESGERPGRPGWSLLEGYAYDVEKKKWRGGEMSKLTPFGEGLRALFGTNRHRPGS